jgi:hypothetical protein
MYPADHDALHALVELFRARRNPRTVAIIDDYDEDDANAHHGHIRPPRSADIVQLPVSRRRG